MRDGRGSRLRNTLSLENKGLPGRRRAPFDAPHERTCLSACQSGRQPAWRTAPMTDEGRSTMDRLAGPEDGNASGEGQCAQKPTAARLDPPAGGGPIVAE